MITFAPHSSESPWAVLNYTSVIHVLVVTVVNMVGHSATSFRTLALTHFPSCSAYWLLAVHS